MGSYISPGRRVKENKRIILPALGFLALGVASIVLLWASGFGAEEAATPTRTLYEVARSGEWNNILMLAGSGVLWALALGVLACHFAREDPGEEKEPLLFGTAVALALIGVFLSPSLVTIVGASGIIVSVAVLRSSIIGSWREEEGTLKRAILVAKNTGTSTKILGVFLIASLMIYLLGNPGAADLELRVLGSVAGVDITNPDALVENITQAQIQLALEQYNATSRLIIGALLSSPMTPEEERVCKPMIERNTYAIDQAAREQIIEQFSRVDTTGEMPEPVSKLVTLLEAFKKYYPVFAALSFLLFMGIARVFIEVFGFFAGLAGAVFSTKT